MGAGVTVNRRRSNYEPDAQPRTGGLKTAPASEHAGLLLFVRAPHNWSAAALVEVLEQVVGGELDLLVAPLGGPALAGGPRHAVEAAEVAVDKGVPGLGLVGGAVGEGQVPLGVLLPGVGLQVGVLVVGAGLDVAPDALEHVLAGGRGGGGAGA